MRKSIYGARLGLVAAAVLGVSAAAAKADAIYTSKLEYKDTGASTPTFSANPYGLVTLDQIDADDIKVTVTLYAPEVGFLNTGGPHDPFLFNLTGDYDVTVTDSAGQTFFDGGFDSNTVTAPNFSATPFGNFTNKIGCCDSISHEKNGASHKSLPPLVFTVHDAAGITFAGVGATFDSTTGRVLTLGTGDHFLSNAGGWWFTADLVDDKGATFNVAARDAIGPLVTTGVPEPATWGLMIVGFGGLGAMLRRKRSALASA